MARSHKHFVYKHAQSRKTLVYLHLHLRPRYILKFNFDEIVNAREFAEIRFITLFLCVSEHSGSVREVRTPPRVSHPMEELQAAVTAHLDQVSGLVQALSSELRRGIGPAADNLRAFVHAVDWKVPSRISIPEKRSRPDHQSFHIFFPLPLELTMAYALCKFRMCAGTMADLPHGIPCDSSIHRRRIEEERQLPALLLVSCL